MGLKLWYTLGAAGLLVSAAVSPALAAAQEPLITGDRWAAYGIIGAIILAIIAFVAVSVGVARRDSAHERSHPHHNVLPGLPVLGEEEDGEDD